MKLFLLHFIINIASPEQLIPEIEIATIITYVFGMVEIMKCSISPSNKIESQKPNGEIVSTMTNMSVDEPGNYPNCLLDEMRTFEKHHHSDVGWN